MSQFTITSYYDFSSTISCGGSPLFVSSVGTGCSSALSLNSNGLACAAYNDRSEYTMMSQKCSTEALNLTSYVRNYVVKQIFVGSESCVGQPLQSIALAADNLCHENPGGKDNNAYIKTNCNGNQPIWIECADSSCSQNCTTVSYTNDPCQLAGAGTSNMVKCFLPTNSSVPLNNSPVDNHNSSIPNGGDVTNPYGNSGTRLVPKLSGVFLVGVLLFSFLPL